ncbi:RNA polymerase sigma factor [Terracoccus luteus]|uniref:RNA polymerase sigma factor n=1 Tax=Terracoccus luteus TaxID=53356 RepID=A0A839PW65_9MICO|nr:sigma-70 family RNA polymerase sigma factor [Terracoccus luteus]MBB2986265.1 RNA polymerase sigma-70 factor (ECF subfamily) [Terracoccus luteus]MCP2172145.1 RNA polymerase sigma-70 factor (ECF subfamily) [Terracoccus luteus]
MHVHDDPELGPAPADTRPEALTDPPVDDDSARLAADLAAGSQDALAAMYERWGSLVHTIAYRALGDRHDAEDVTQQVFVSAWHGRHSLRPEAGSLGAWLVGITKHRIADLRTQRYRAHRNLQAVAAESVTRPTSVDDDLAERLLIVHELERIGDPRATVLRMAFIEDRSHDDIARALELPLGTVKSHVRRGLTQLRRRLEEVRRATP